MSWANFPLTMIIPYKYETNKKTIPKWNDKSEFLKHILNLVLFYVYWVEKKKYIFFKKLYLSSWPYYFPLGKMKDSFWGCTDLSILLISDPGTHSSPHYSPFSFLSLEMNFFGGITPTFFFCVAMLWKRSARHVSKFSFFFCWALYASTFSRNGRQKYKAWSTELQ